MAHLERVAIHIRRVVGATGETSVAHSVYCPVRHESKLLVDCETCDLCAELTPEESFVVCELPPGTAPVKKRGSPMSISADTTIGEVMTRDVVCIDAGLNVDAVRALLLEHNISGVPVVDGQGFPVGVVSKTDFLQHGMDTGRASPTTAIDIMMPIAFTLEESRPLADAVTLMATEGVHRLPIVDPDGRVTGILSTMDILRWLDG